MIAKAPNQQTADIEVHEHEVHITRDDRRYRIRGLAKNTSYDQLKINLMVSRDDLMHVDMLDLYDARRRITFCKQAGPELFVDEATIKQDLGHILLQLEQLQQQNIEQKQAVKDQAYQMTDAEKQAALQLLEAPNLIERITNDFDRCGIVGEQTNKLVGYLAATSRKLRRPLAIVVQSSSAAGKSSFMDAVLSFIPPEDQVRVSAMTGQSLFYMGQDGLKHKVLAIAEEGGAEQATYALKLLQSDGQLTLTTTERNSDTGRNASQTYHVEGPTSLFLTTTASDIDDEFLNRCIVLTVDEDRQQTRAIHQQQRLRHTLGGQLDELHRETRRQLHHNAQRLLRPLRVINPYADQLTFIDHQTRNRRDHEAYLTLIDTEGPLGVRDRALLEVLYSTGMRRTELAMLSIHDLDRDRRAITIRHGKGDKQRVVPIGERALVWLLAYLDNARPLLLIDGRETRLFITRNGVPFVPNALSDLVKKHFRSAGITKPGSCHLFRHTAATLMLENGADIRYIQALLGHADLNSTQIYTHVSIAKLREVHDATHPAKPGRSGASRDVGRNKSAPFRQITESEAPQDDHEEDGGALAAV